MFSPNFANDISNLHEKTFKSKKITLRDNYQFDMYFDGIHPTTDLARVWLKKIALQIQKDRWG
jgi:lysophospholipase L1-like esterase